MSARKAKVCLDEDTSFASHCTILMWGGEFARERAWTWRPSVIPAPGVRGGFPAARFTAMNRICVKSHTYPLYKIVAICHCSIFYAFTLLWHQIHL